MQEIYVQGVWQHVACKCVVLEYCVVAARNWTWVDSVGPRLCGLLANCVRFVAAVGVFFAHKFGAGYV